MRVTSSPAYNEYLARRVHNLAAVMAFAGAGNVRALSLNTLTHYFRRCLFNEEDWTSAEPLTRHVVAIMRSTAPRRRRLRVEFVYAVFDCASAGVPLHRIKTKEVMRVQYNEGVNGMNDQDLRAILNVDVTSFMQYCMSVDGDISGEVLFSPLAFDIYAED